MSLLRRDSERFNNSLLCISKWRVTPRTNMSSLNFEGHRSFTGCLNDCFVGEDCKCDDQWLGWSSEVYFFRVKMFPLEIALGSHSNIETCFLLSLETGFPVMPELFSKRAAHLLQPRAFKTTNRGKKKYYLSSMLRDNMTGYYTRSSLSSIFYMWTGCLF